MRTLTEGELVDAFQTIVTRFRHRKPQPSWSRQEDEGLKKRFLLRSRVNTPFIDTEIREREHLDYLQRMGTDGVIPASLATRAKVIWWMAKFVTSGTLPVPAAAAFSGGPVEYHWTARPHQLSAEIPSEGLCHWTYRNSTTGKLWGREVDGPDFPASLRDYLALVAESSR